MLLILQKWLLHFNLQQDCLAKLRASYSQRVDRIVRYLEFKVNLNNHYLNLLEICSVESNLKIISQMGYSAWAQIKRVKSDFQ